MAKLYWIGGTASHLNDWNTAANWSSGSIPATADSVWIDQNAAAAIASFNASAVQLAELHIGQSNTQTIGDAAAKLQIGADLLGIGEPSPNGQTFSGAGRLNLDLGTSASAVTVYNTASSPTDTGKEPVRIICNNSSTRLTVLAGTVGLATDTLASTATLGEIDISGPQGQVNLSSGVTVTTLNQTNGKLISFAGCATLSQQAGQAMFAGTGAIASATIGGRLTLNMRAATGATITTLEVLAGGIVDLSQNTAAITITTLKLRPGGKLIFNKATGLTGITITNPVQVIGADTLAAA